jgi:hypothetical protein
MLSKVLRFLLLGFIVVFAVACGTAETPKDTTPTFEDAYKRVTEATLSAGDAVPAPTGEVILTFRGNVGTTNVDNTLQFDMDTLEKLGLVEYSVNDVQAEGKVVTFQGVLLKDLLAVAKIPAGTTTLHMIALNDYAVDFPAADAEQFPVMLATKVDGQRMTVEHYGPTRIVYPTDTFKLDPAQYDPLWIWQLATIEVK